MRLRIFWWGISVCLAAATWCGGAESDSQADDKAKIYVGLGGVVTSKPYTGVDAKVYPVPLFGYEGERLYFRGLTGGYRVIAKDGWGIGPVLQPRFDGYEQDDSAALRGMGDRHWSVDAGVGVSLLTKVGLFGLSCVTDILGQHGGQELEFSYTLMFPVGGFDVIPSAGVRWKSEDLVDYYFGVEPNEEALGRPDYQGDDAVNPYVRVAVRRKLGERWSLLAAVQYEWLDGPIEDSPIVDESYDGSILFGLLYSW